jgi:hypothetical protein
MHTRPHQMTPEISLASFLAALTGGTGVCSLSATSLRLVSGKAHLARPEQFSLAELQIDSVLNLDGEPSADLQGEHAGVSRSDARGQACHGSTRRATLALVERFSVK